MITNISDHKDAKIEASVFLNLKNVGQDVLFGSICVILQPQKQYQIKERQR